MRVGDHWYRTIWEGGDGAVMIIDQTELPARFVTRAIATSEEMAEAIRSMRVRGAPLIGVSAAFGVALGLREDPSDAGLDRVTEALRGTRPTAINLHAALHWMRTHVEKLPFGDRAESSRLEAARLADLDVATCQAIGRHGESMLRDRWSALGASRPLEILTHCNAGWLGTVDWGTAMAPIYRAHDEGIPVHVWVSETRPRQQGLLTAWELAGHGVPHTVVVDGAAGLLMRQGRVDVCLVGTDRVAQNGDLANKIGTYPKALAAADNGVPFYVAAPSTSIDWTLPNGEGIPIESRSGEELGFDPSVPVENLAFDVTPARLVTGGLITERGIAPASRAGMAELFPERGP